MSAASFIILDYLHLQKALKLKSSLAFFPLVGSISPLDISHVYM